MHKKNFTIKLNDGRNVNVSFEPFFPSGKKSDTFNVHSFGFRSRAISSTGYRSEFIYDDAFNGRTPEQVAKDVAEDLAKEVKPAQRTLL